MLTAELPAALREALARELPVPASPAAAMALSCRYRDPAVAAGPRARSRTDVAAYAATRLPATYAAAAVVLGELRARAPSFAPRSQLDLGAGLGSGLWAAAATWPTLVRATAVELESAMLGTGGRLAAAGPAPLATTTWLQADAAAASFDGPFDLVTIGYMLNELDARAAEQVIERAWAATEGAAGGALVVVEPGTPDGSRRVLATRERLLRLGGFVAAPCPHELPCPLGEGDWCHFAVRLPRSAQHRVAKRGQAPFEDEKFAYVVLTRQEVPRAPARILRHPRVRGGHVRLALCARDGLRDVVVSKREREAFREARKASWGEAFEAAL